MTTQTVPRPRRLQYGKLVWVVGSKETVLFDNMEWHALNRKRKELISSGQYRNGKLVLRYMFN